MTVQEDRFVCHESNDMSYYAVFDGHAGSEASSYCQKHLHAKLSASIQSSDPGQNTKNKLKKGKCHIKSVTDVL